MSKEPTFIKKKIAAFLSWFRQGPPLTKGSGERPTTPRPDFPQPLFKLRLEDSLSGPLSQAAAAATELRKAFPPSDHVLTTEAQQDTYMWQYRQLRTSGMPWEEARRQALELALKVRT